MADDQTIAVRGVETVCYSCEGHAKAIFSFVATITADGSKLPLILIAKGKIDYSHKQPRSRDYDIYDVWHSPSEWSTVPLMTQYLKGLRAQILEEPVRLITDQYTTHTAPETKNETEELGIKIIWVPKDGTGRYQPLDRRTFDAIKSNGKAKWLRYFNNHYDVRCTQEIGAELMLESWHKFSESAVLAGWDYGKLAEDDDDNESDDSDDEFEFRMCTDSSDDNVEELQNSLPCDDEDE
jgi:hypothetical protein